MARSLVSVAVVVALAAVVCTAAPLNNAYEFMLLVQQWPAGVCQTNLEHPCAIPTGVDSWTMHGMWPSRNDTTYPQNCNSKLPYNKNAITPIRSEMEVGWTNLFTDSPDDSFWSHEWTRHGTCSLDIVKGEEEYFAAALNLRKSHDYGHVLASNGVPPSSSNTYSVNDIVVAIRKGFGADPLLWCAYHKGKGQYLIQLGLCFDKGLSTAFMCDERVYDTGSCDDKQPIYYWPVQH